VTRLAACALIVCAAPLLAQTVTLRGVVTDETGARVPSAKVTVSGPGGDKQTEVRDDGSYFFASLPPGDFTVRASAPDLTLPQPVKITLSTGIQTLDLQLKVAGTVQEVTVAGDAVTVSTEASNNASATTLKGTDLDALSDDPEDLADDLAALAGPSAGPNGGTIFVDGFSGSELPPKSSIREIRINSNPFSPEYDRLGFGASRSSPNPVRTSCADRSPTTTWTISGTRAILTRRKKRRCTCASWKPTSEGR